jgi:tRNA (mo5U34)-methyltransferase
MDLPEMIHPLLAHLHRFGLARYETALRDRLDPVVKRIQDKDRKARTYLEMLADLPAIEPSSNDLDHDRIRIGQPGDLDPDGRRTLREALKTMIPWRKGPFDVFGIPVDSEWDSSLKWDRVRPHLPPLKGQRILDIGSSCGYYMFRMCADAPALVLGIEPYLTFYFQFQLLQQYIRDDRVFTLPLRLEAFPAMPGCFDTVFCMGILYHQRDPIQALENIRPLLTSGGQLVMETLVLAQTGDAILTPPGRYAKMNNVYAIPTVTRLEKWLHMAGYRHVRCVDVTPTTLDEQRPTDWINSESLDAFLDPLRPGLTVEGHPAPLRAVVMAQT